MNKLHKDELAAAVGDLQKGDGASNAVDSLEKLIVQILYYSINMKLQESSISTKAETGDFYLKNEIFIEKGELKAGFVISVEITNLASESM